MKNRTKMTLMMVPVMVAGVLGAGSPLAAPPAPDTGTLCSGYTLPDTHPEGLLVDEMKFGGNNADDCYGVVEDNDTGDNVWATSGWTLLAKDDTPGNPGSGSGTVKGIQFTLSSDAGTFGSWSLSWLKTGDPGYDLTMDLVGVIKASDRFASYLFSDELFTADGTGGGSWKVSYLNNGGQTPTLSHLSLYYRDAVHSSSSSSTSSSTSTSGGQEVPEPGSAALLGVGILAAAFRWRRRNREAS